MLWNGISGNAFIDCFQIGDSTSRRYFLNLSRRLCFCNLLTGIYMRKPMKSDARHIVAFPQEIQAPQYHWMIISLDITKIHEKNDPQHERGNFRVRSLPILDQKQLLITLMVFACSIWVSWNVHWHQYLGSFFSIWIYD